MPKENIRAGAREGKGRKMKHKIFLTVGVVSFLLSFVVHQYFIQFIVLGVFFMVLYISSKNSQDLEELKHVIREHNELVRKDIAELKK